MFNSIDAEKTCGKIQHTFMIKILQKVSIKGTYLNTIKATYDKPKLILYPTDKSIPPSIFPSIRVFSN